MCHFPQNWATCAPFESCQASGSPTIFSKLSKNVVSVYIFKTTGQLNSHRPSKIHVFVEICHFSPQMCHFPQNWATCAPFEPCHASGSPTIFLKLSKNVVIVYIFKTTGQLNSHRPSKIHVFVEICHFPLIQVICTPLEQLFYGDLKSVFLSIPHIFMKTHLNTLKFAWGGWGEAEGRLTSHW